MLPQRFHGPHITRVLPAKAHGLDWALSKGRWPSGLQLLVSWAQERPQSTALYQQVAAPGLPIEIMSLLGFLPPAPLSTQGSQGSAEAAGFIRCQRQFQSQFKTFKMLLQNAFVSEHK